MVVAGAATNAAIYALIAFSLVLVYRGSGVINFGVGYIVVFAGIFFANTAGSGWASLGLAVLVGALLGVATYLLAVRFAERAHAPHAALAIATLGFGLVIEYIGGELWARQGYTSDALWSGSIEVAGVSISNQRIFTILMAVACFALVILLLERTMIGWMLEAVAFKPSVAGVYGISTVVALILVWMIAGAVAGLAGALMVPLSAVSLPLALGLAIKGFAAAVVGGLGSVSGAAVGAIVVAFAEAFFIQYVSTDYASLLAFILLFIMIVLRPQGLLGSKREVVRV
jgi:branched-chain amino acid transport system permease protein